VLDRPSAAKKKWAIRLYKACDKGRGCKCWFTSGACSNGIGQGGSPPNRKENRLFELWDQKGLNGTNIKPGMIISSLNEYDKYL
jgi:hypothetical protein